MKTISLTIILPILILACGKERLVNGVSDTLALKLDSIGQSFINTGQVVGISVAIMQDTSIIYNQGFGYTDPDRTNPVTNNTRFLLASVSKLIGSTLVMRLVEEGRLSLDQTLYELLPDFPNPEQAKRITVQHMLSHTSGLQDYAVDIDSVYVKTREDPTKDDFYNFFNGRELFFEPGDDYSYSNSGFLLMSMIVERVTGNTFQDEINRVINRPAGLDLQLIKKATLNSKMSKYWELKNSEFFPYPHWTWIQGDGGLTATSAMLAQFPRKWATGKIISQASFQKMITPIILNNGLTTGYGIGVRNGEFMGDKIIGHTGGHKSTYSIMVYFPERRLSFVCFMNTDNTPLSIRKIFAEFARAVLDKNIPNYENGEIPTDNLANYEGTYQNFDYKMKNKVSIQLNAEDNHLYYCVGDDCNKMISIGEHKFWIAEWPYDLVTFYVDESGVSSALKEYYTGYYSVLRKRVK